MLFAIRQLAFKRLICQFALIYTELNNMISIEGFKFNFTNVTFAQNTRKMNNKLRVLDHELTDGFMAKLMSFDLFAFRISKLPLA